VPEIRLRRRALVVPALLTASVAALGLAGCATGPAGADGGDRLRVVTTTTQITDFTQNVAGDLVDLTALLAPGASAHHFDPTAAQLQALGQADVLVVNGAGLEEWLDSAIEASGFDGTTVDSSEGIDLSGEHTHDHGDEGDDHAHEDEAHADEAHADEAHTDEAHTDEAHAEDEAHDHDHADGNPHIWTDPSIASEQVDNIAAGLAAADADNAADFEANAAAYTQQLADLDTWIAENVDAVPEADRVVVSNHDAFHYYLEHYDITFVGSIIPSFEDNAEPSAAELDALVSRIDEYGVKAIFSESSISSKTADAIGAAAGVEVYSGEDALYGDSLGAEGSEGDTYLDATIHNTRLILQSWGAEPTELPADLRS